MLTFHANGKLLITGEYAVLDGAKAIATPCRFGQLMKVVSENEENISWQSKKVDGSIWFEGKFALDLTIIESSDEAIGNRLQQILYATRKLKPSFLENGGIIHTELEFPVEWGLGTSSTLISLIAQFANVDPFTLYANTFGGSGYDIACATSNSPILFSLVNQKPIVNPIHLDLPFHEDLYFVYLGKKQNSRDGIQQYRKQKGIVNDLVTAISDISEKILMSQIKEDFVTSLDAHETLISEFLNIQEVKKVLFSDFNGIVKSLGAWGGDFVLVVSNLSSNETKEYFDKKGFSTVIPYHKMVMHL